MNEKEVSVMLGMLRVVYGNQIEEQNPEIAIKLWRRFLSDEPSDLVQLAIDEYIAKNTYAPKPADILRLIEAIKSNIYSQFISADVLGDSPKRLPREYLPRYITHAPKVYQIEDEKCILRKLGIEKIGLLGESLMSMDDFSGDAK